MNAMGMYHLVLLAGKNATDMSPLPSIGVRLYKFTSVFGLSQSLSNSDVPTLVHLEHE